MNQIQDDLVASLAAINNKIKQNIDLSSKEIEILLISSLWSEESNERN